MSTGGSFKTPPALSKSSSYENWLKEIKVWQKLTELDVRKQGPAILLSLEGKAKDSVLELDIDDIAKDGGVLIIIAKLDKLYLKDKAQTAYEAYDKFEKFQRSSDMSIKDFVYEFERLHAKTTSYGSSMSSDILAYRLLKSANISNSHQQLIRATIDGDLTYDKMKCQLNRVFSDVSLSSPVEDADTSNVKVESICEATVYDPTDIYYGNMRRGGYSHGRGQFPSRGSGYQGKYRNSGRDLSGTKPTGNRGFARGGLGRKSKRGCNSSSENGYTSRCAICESINHWVANCTDVVYGGY